jgi:hypothetical protein
MDLSTSRARLHNLVDDVVCQGVHYSFEISILRNGRHALGLVRSGAVESVVLGGVYPSRARLAERGRRDLLAKGVPPAVVAYVIESLHLITAYA